MTDKGKITITEIFLLLLTVVFLALALGMHLWNAQRGAAGTYTVTTQKAAEVPSDWEKVDINRADAQQLQKLEGIGPVLAQRIVDWRSANGGFSTIEDLLQVEGIGPATLEGMRDFIIIGESS